MTEERLQLLILSLCDRAAREGVHLHSLCLDETVPKDIRFRAFYGPFGKCEISYSDEIK